jgi:preprotein translocase subunit SecG
MQVWMTLILVLQMLAALTMIGLVLIQHGKGADMGASFGSGASGSLFGATGSANFLSRSTAVAATIFFVCTLVLALLSNQGARTGGGTSVLDRAAPAASAPAAGQIPGAANSGVPVPIAPTAPTAPSPAVPAPAVPAPASAAAK